VEVCARHGGRHYTLQDVSGLLSVGRDSEFAGFNIIDTNVNLPDVRAIPVDGQDDFVPVILAGIVPDVEVKEGKRLLGDSSEED
jgi:hypothetical protein